MKQTNLLSIACIFVFVAINSLFAQQGNVAAGGDATGTGGSMSYSTGQVDYLVYTSPQGSLSLGLQQTWFAVPQVLEIPETIISGGQSLCFNATETVIVAGNGKHFTVESGAHADIIAGHNIQMKEGTTVETGGSLHAFISDQWCDQQPAILAADIEKPFAVEQNVESQNEFSFFKVYPNPTNGDFTLEILLDEELCLLFVEIYTIHGNVITQEELPAKGLYHFSLADKQAGIYILHIFNNNHTESVKIIRQ